MPDPDFRDVSFRVRMHADERDQLARLAAQEGLTASDWVRQAIRRAYADLSSDAKPKDKGRKK